MKLIKLILVSMALGFSLDDVGQKIEQMQQVNQKGIGGFVIRKGLEYMPLIPPEELFKEKDTVLKSSDIVSSILQPIPANVNSGYISVQIYYRDIAEMNYRIKGMETNLAKLTDVTANVQKSSFDSSSFILKLIEICGLLLLGGNGFLAWWLRRK